VDAIVHLAARVHVIKDTAADPAAEFHKVNVDGSRRLAEAAIRAGVRCFVFLSSIKVNGEQTQDRPFTEDAIASPCGPYAQSKWRAEQILHQLARQASMEVVVIRPPLVYGPNVKGNFQELLRLVARGCLLPLGGIRNRRSLIYVENLADLIVHCISHPSATGTFLVSDGQDLSTPDLIRRLGTVLDRQPYLMPVPPTLLHLAGKLLGREDMIRRLCASLTIDSGRVRRLLQWEPPYSLDQGIERTASAYLSQ